jgi:hypothetical protein
VTGLFLLSALGVTILIAGLTILDERVFIAGLTCPGKMDNTGGGLTSTFVVFPFGSATKAVDSAVIPSTLLGQLTTLVAATFSTCLTGR